MELQHVNIKIHVDGELALAPERFIEVFHEWIREHRRPELLIDVADYCHVPTGPGVLLVGHEADYAMDQAQGRWGLLYNRKAAVPGSNPERFAQALAAAAAACGLLEQQLGGEGLAFSRQSFELLVNDRALAPNVPETYTACRPEVEQFLQATLGHAEYTLQPHDQEPRRRFGFEIACGRPFDLSALAR